MEQIGQKSYQGCIYLKIQFSIYIYISEIILKHYRLYNNKYTVLTSGASLLFSNRVEAWTRDVPFLLRQEGRPVTDLVGDTSTKRVMIKDWNITDAAVQWIRHTAASLAQPFGLYVGLNLPHPYRTDSLGPTAGGSTFRTSPYWLNKASWFAWSNRDINNL